MTVTGDRRRLLGSSRQWVAGAAILNLQLLVVLVYLAIVEPRVTRPLYYLYPFIWINVGGWAVWRTTVEHRSVRGRRIGLLVGVLYFLVLGYTGGLYGLGGGQGQGLRVVLAALPPGWAPALIYGGDSIQLAILPFKLIGYLALAYLVYATVADAAAGLLGGILGLFSCVSCTLPVIAGVLSGFVGGGGALVTAAYGQSYPLSTLIFVVTVGLLVWRPTISGGPMLAGRLGERN